MKKAFNLAENTIQVVHNNGSKNLNYRFRLGCRNDKGKCNRNELIKKPSPAFVVFANAQTQLLHLLDLLQARRVSPTERCSCRLNLLAIRTCFAPSVRKSALTKREGIKNYFLTSLPTNLLTFKPAFTLAEVLITLGIIGVVAAMTIPTLMTAYQKKQTVTRLKRAYSIVQQSIRLSEDENGEVESWNTTLNGDQFFKTYLANHIKYLDKYTSQELWDKAPRKNLNGYAYTGTTYNATSTTTAHFTLLDGSMVSMNWVGSTMWVGIDINGLAKPNTIGKDTFLFNFTSKYGLRPLGDVGTPDTWSYGTYSRTNVGPKGASYLACKPNSSGYWCAALIMNDGWDMASDYPWKTK